MSARDGPCARTSAAQCALSTKPAGDRALPLAQSRCLRAMSAALRPALKGRSGGQARRFNTPPQSCCRQPRAGVLPIISRLGPARPPPFGGSVVIGANGLARRCAKPGRARDADRLATLDTEVAPPPRPAGG